MNYRSLRGLPLLEAAIDISYAKPHIYTEGRSLPPELFPYAAPLAAIFQGTGGAQRQYEETKTEWLRASASWLVELLEDAGYVIGKQISFDDFYESYQINPPDVGEIAALLGQALEKGGKTSE